MERLLWFTEITDRHAKRVGGKAFSLGELTLHMSSLGLRVPGGFVVTTDGYASVIRGIAGRLASILKGLDPARIDRLNGAARRCRDLVENAKLPPDLSRAIRAAYRRLGGKKPIPVAVRSSAVGEDGAEASFAGQQDTYLNIRGEEGVLRAYRRCLGSLFTARAISYRLSRGIDPAASEMAVVVQQLVRADLGGAGVAFTIDPESGHDEFLVVNAIYGYGENLVQGKVNPDEYLLFKPNLLNDKDPIIARRIGSKRLALSCSARGGMRNRLVPRALRVKPVLRYDEILAVARMSLRIEAHYKRPMDIEWVKDGESGRFTIVQARPETVHGRAGGVVHERVHMDPGAVRPIVEGISVGEKAAHGVVRVVKDPTHPQGFRPGDILVSEKTDPDWEPIMKRAAAIVTDRGGRTCHAAIVSRELGIPAVVGAETATRRLATGAEVTVSCAEGQTGFVYPGKVPFRVERLSLEGLARPRTKVMVNIGNPDVALKTGRLPCDGVGLARVEFIIANRIGVHPNALVDPSRLPERVLRRVQARVADRPDGREYFIQTLAEGVATIGAAFYPRETIVRLSDFKSDEYANLLGGRFFEPKEENPMLGLRGASRYIHPDFRAAFELECEALRRVREDYGLTNVKLMVPFCRTLAEADEVLRILARHGLRQGRRGLEIYVMCEIPSNVVLAAEFAERFDGFSIGSNDLTQLALGVDRNAGHLSTLFDERNPAVKRLVAEVISVCKRMGRKVGICGQAPSDYPDFCRFLVDCGIDSISLNPDQVVPMTRQIVRFESGGGRRRIRPADGLPRAAGAELREAGEGGDRMAARGSATGDEARAAGRER
jgi:pyruvate,water dikinase